jgi:hypothetical protein
MAEEERLMGRELYGTRSDLLPAFARSHPGESGEPVTQLTSDESRELEAASLSRFPATSASEIDWRVVSYRSRLFFQDEADWERIAADLLSDYSRRGDQVAIFWGTLALPTIVMPATVAVKYARQILNVGPHFWICPLGGQEIIECLPDGQVTVASAPSD